MNDFYNNIFHLLNDTYAHCPPALQNDPIATPPLNLNTKKRWHKASKKLVILYFNTVSKIAVTQTVTKSSCCEPLHYVNKWDLKCKCPSCDKIQIEENLGVRLTGSLPCMLRQISSQPFFFSFCFGECGEAVETLCYQILETESGLVGPLVHYRAAFSENRDMIFIDIFEPCLRQIFS